ncbi:ribonuclease HII [Candidatus Sneabacter namystus]|uniref:Ribonuclease n=1 Tax=Candidatus Sneabacter namystus TaxID=2601646 RepID=A0A5C0UJ35_9RICK|nr:ribonuclease HII [Candidatus Sneabacter namystus]QEK39523.1 ribonuclease HII [Candidatus Sneabacter namystus]
MPNLELENSVLGDYIAGVDEVGCGALAGPVVAVSFVMHKRNFKHLSAIRYVNDSKKLSLKKREQVYNLISSIGKWSVGMVSHEEIDRFNIREASKIACMRAIYSSTHMPDFCIIDGNMNFVKMENYISVVSGDSKSLLVAAASIIAKITRDRLMLFLHEEDVRYNWDENKGYGTHKHISKIKLYGPSKYHRKYFIDHLIK